MPKISNGELILTMRLTEKEISYDAPGINVRTMRKGNSFLINGTKLFVAYAHLADYIVCSTRLKDGGKKKMGSLCS